MTLAASFAFNDDVKAPLNNFATCIAVPSIVFSAIFPLKPSVTTTSAVPSIKSRPSILPIKLIGALCNCLKVFFINVLPFVSSVPTFNKATLGRGILRSEEHTSELQSRFDLVCRLLLEKKNYLLLLVYAFVDYAILV